MQYDFLWKILYTFLVFPPLLREYYKQLSGPPKIDAIIWMATL